MEGQVRQGWDTMREEILARQLVGVVPEGTKLPPKPEAIPDWDRLTADEKNLFARQAEVFAGFVEMTDHEIGRVVEAIDSIGQLDNTLIVLVYGDNGTSAEGGRNGMFSEMTYFNGVQEQVADMLEAWTSGAAPRPIRTWRRAGPSRSIRPSPGPSRWLPTSAAPRSAWRSTGLRASGAKADCATQFAHVIDVAPTILEAAGLPEPNMVNGVPQSPMDGVSMLYTFDDPQARNATRRSISRCSATGPSITRVGGHARSTRHHGRQSPRHALADDVWELYDTSKDFSLANDLSEEMPEKLAEMKTMFMVEAGRNTRLADRRSTDRACERGGCRAA